MIITISLHCGQPPVRSTSCTSSRRLSLRTRGRVTPLSRLEHGRAARSRCRRPAAAGHAMAAARDLSGAARHAAYAAGQAAAVAHVAAHELGAAAYAIKAARGCFSRRGREYRPARVPLAARPAPR